VSRESQRPVHAGARAVQPPGPEVEESILERLQRAEEQVRRASSILQATLESTMDGFLVVDRDGRIVSHNRRFQEIWGIPAAVLRGGDEARALGYAAEGLESPEEFLRDVRALYAEPNQDAYATLRFRDGRVVERYTRPQRIGDEIIGRVWTFRDVTEQTRMEEQLLASEHRYRRLFEESRHALYITTRDGDFVDVNEAMVEMFGYTRETFLSLNAAALYADPAGRAEFQRSIEERDALRNYEVRLKDRTGRPLDCLVSARARRSPDGLASGYEGIIEDVTERKRVIEALRQSERYFRSLIENALDTITILEADGTIRYESPAVERVLGYSPEELLGRNVFDLIHPEDRETVRAAFPDRGGGTGATTSLEVRFRHHDGSWRTMEVVGKNMLADPSVGGVVVNARDVTQRKEAEERLLHDAFHDRLTGLPNRALFMDRLAQLVRRGRAAKRRASRCCSWMWTVSSRSTTAWVTGSATSSWWRSAAAWRVSPAGRHRGPGGWRRVRPAPGRHHHGRGGRAIAAGSTRPWNGPSSWRASGVRSREHRDRPGDTALCAR
jgi:PAS domain S-box-containing protein